MFSSLLPDLSKVFGIDPAGHKNGVVPEIANIIEVIQLSYKQSVSIKTMQQPYLGETWSERDH